jgi:hypothetical protein
MPSSIAITSLRKRIVFSSVSRKNSLLELSWGVQQLLKVWRGWFYISSSPTLLYNFLPTGNPPCIFLFIFGTMDYTDGEIVTYHAAGNLPLYDIPYEIVVGNTIKDCAAHGETLFPGASLSKALDSSAYACKMQKPGAPTKYMILVEVCDETELAAVLVSEAVAMSWYLMDEVNMICDTKNHDTQKFVVKSIFEQVTNVIGVFFNKLENSSDDGMGDL